MTRLPPFFAAGRAAVDADAAAGALVVVDDEDRARGLGQRLQGLGLRARHDVRGHHVDALPRADVLAGAAEDAQLRRERDVPLGLDPLLQPVGVDGAEDVVVVDLDAVVAHR